ncbi:helix-turn-helix domain-containing protein [uncultured Tateyamaria sp.]|uniref:helix-turn-helix domain-containing protein n=1 Tax=Tateyamaria sp. 1078 TaxID=3417464 RepID=UPI00261B7A37|nr:helix-turn-helix domain-containing protein [uncultured Tateyamaria sp.]
MAREALAGTRIRERRIMTGLKQADLARNLGISASYLNLIEHNRRRIGGKLLLDIASALSVDPSVLTEGAEAALIATLREAAASQNMGTSEAERVDEFAGRFPGWAEALAAAHRRIGTLERTVETLSDRLAYDPNLAASVHEVLSTAASIRATASILAEDPDLSLEWRGRFHANLDTDSQRLADSSKALVGFLDAETGEAASGLSIQEEVEAFLGANDYRFDGLDAQASTASDVLAAAPELTTDAARRVARTVLRRIAGDQAALSDAVLGDAVAQHGLDPIRIANACGVPVAQAMRRLALLQDQSLGLIVADRSGSLIFRKAVSGFAIPRHGATCPLWPVFEAQARPGVAICTRVEMLGRGTALFDCYAIADVVGPATANVAPLTEATMLMVPVSADDRTTAPDPLPLGPSCRICPRRDCPGRREPSILSEGF